MFSEEEELTYCPNDFGYVWFCTGEWHNVVWKWDIWLGSHVKIYWPDDLIICVVETKFAWVFFVWQEDKDS